VGGLDRKEGSQGVMLELLLGRRPKLSPRANSFRSPYFFVEGKLMKEGFFSLASSSRSSVTLPGSREFIQGGRDGGRDWAGAGLSLFIRERERERARAHRDALERDGRDAAITALSCAFCVFEVCM
jgi:hypothetical protein